MSPAPANPALADPLRPPTVLIVDDSPENLSVLHGLLKSRCRVLAANSGERALRIAGGPERPDLVLLDVMMPGMDGHQTLARLRESPVTREVPVIFLTALESRDEELRGFGAGAVDFITKPFIAPVLLARVSAQLELKRIRDELARHNAHLETEVARRMADNEAIQQVTIRALARLAETRDPETGNHIIRTQNYVRRLATGLRIHSKHRALLTNQYIELLARSAPLHDIGKVGIPDAILLKPGPLTAEEWTVMRTHAAIGAQAIEEAEHDVDRPIEFLRVAKGIARSHHERWDGTGYPDRLAGDAIPLCARLMALADVFDALTSRRAYKEPMSAQTAREIIVAGRGSHFDPDVVDAFTAGFEDFLAIAGAHADHD